MIEVSQPDDERLAGYRDLLAGGRRSRPGDEFVVEGVRAVGNVLELGIPLRSVLISQAQAEHHPYLTAAAQAAGADVYEAPAELFDRVAGYHAHRGVLALAARPAPELASDLAGRSRLVLVVEAVNDFENLGALFRNAAAFGAGAVLLDPRTADPLYRRVVRVSLGHALRVPWARVQPWPDGLRELRDEAGLELVALTPKGDADLSELVPDRRVKVALMVGSEGEGLSPVALDAADRRVRIGMAAGVDSVNVATAAAIALHHFSQP